MALPPLLLPASAHAVAAATAAAAVAATAAAATAAAADSSWLPAAGSHLLRAAAAVAAGAVGDSGCPGGGTEDLILEIGEVDVGRRLHHRVSAAQACAGQAGPVEEAQPLRELLGEQGHPIRPLRVRGDLKPSDSRRIQSAQKVPERGHWRL